MSDQNPNDPNQPQQPRSPFNQGQNQPQQPNPYGAPQQPQQGFPQNGQQPQAPQQPYNPVYGQYQQQGQYGAPQQPQQPYNPAYGQAPQNPYGQQPGQYGQPQFGGPQAPWNGAPQGAKRSPLVWILSGVAAVVVIIVIIVSVVVVGGSKGTDKTAPITGGSSTSAPSDGSGSTGAIKDPTSAQTKALRTTENDTLFNQEFNKLGFTKTTLENARDLALRSCVILAQNPDATDYAEYILQSGDPYENGEAVAIGASAYCPTQSARLQKLLTSLSGSDGSSDSSTNNY